MGGSGIFALPNVLTLPRGQLAWQVALRACGEMSWTPWRSRCSREVTRAHVRHLAAQFSRSCLRSSLVLAGVHDLVPHLAAPNEGEPMAKVNVNSATREELVDVAGLRPDIADAVLEFRREHHKIADAQALEELPGVGPATVDQLRQALDFGDQAEAGGKDAGRSVEKAAEATRHAAEGGARAASTTAREGTEIVRRAFGAAAETEREVVGRSAEGAAELGRLWVDLLGEQTRHNVRVAAALSQAVRWDEIAQAQTEFVRVSLERLQELNRRYLEIVRVMTEAAPAAAERARKAG